MSSRSGWFGSAVVLAVSGLVFVGACWAYLTAPRTEAARERDARLASARQGVSSAPAVGAAVAVDAWVVQRSEASEVVELAGVLEPVRSVWVAAEVEGRIVEVAAHEHAPVAAGDLLVRLDADLARAAALRAKAQHRLRRQELERQRALGERAVSSAADLDRVQAEERSAWATLLEARTRLDRTRIRAPFAGVVNRLELDPGAYLRPGDRVAQVLDTAAIEIEVGVSDLEVGGLEPGDPARVRIDPLGAEPFEGQIERLGRAPDEATQRYPVVIRLENAEGRLLPGMLATVELETGARSAIRIPRRAVEREFELDYVYVLEGDLAAASARRRRVSTLPVPFRPDLVEVAAGLEPGERIAVSGVADLRDGAAVRARSTHEGGA